MKKNIIFLLLILFFLILLILILLYKSKEISSSPMENLSECNVLQFSSYSAINIVFLADKKTAEKYADFLFKISPFDKNKDKFNLYYIDTDFECSFYKDTSLFCYSKDILKKASSCPADYIFALKKEKREIRSTSYLNLMSLNLNHPMVVLHHEFGHSFANLAEEYVPAEVPKNSRNCVDSCDRFDINNGCFKGCSEQHLYRSIENGIMRTLSSNSYGIFNERIFSQLLNKSESSLKNKITGEITLEDGNCKEQKYILAPCSYNPETGEIKILEQHVEKGCAGSNGNGPLSYALMAEDNRLIEGYFNQPILYTDLPNEDGLLSGETYPSREFILRLPFIKNATKLAIYNENKTEIATIKLNIGSTPCRIK